MHIKDDAASSICHVPMQLRRCLNTCSTGCYGADTYLYYTTNGFFDKDSRKVETANDAKFSPDLFRFLFEIISIYYLNLKSVEST